ncbi:DUF6677 family protein [Shewanella waksmanii]|uniref:DUF6677 family protein n=1 Tax=Shewanella waksmanii TaxID=213783 RepID=UPI0004AF2C0D|nr:DUF6677 family protein [Shewanella waksmanii]
MHRAAKAALLSAFICPGSGHFYLRRYNRGTLISCCALLGLGFLLVQAVHQARNIISEFTKGNIKLDLSEIYALVSQSSNVTNDMWVNVATVMFAGAWLYGIVDAYRIGRKDEQSLSSI